MSSAITPQHLSVGGVIYLLCSNFPRGHYLVWRFRVSFGVRVDVRVMVCKLFGSDFGQGNSRVIVRVRGRLGLRLVVVVRP